MRRRGWHRWPALLGLRSLLFLLAGMVDQLHHLKVDFAGILTFVSLAAIATMLAASLVASVSYARRHPHTAAPLHAEEERREVAAHRGQAIEET